MNCLTQKEQDLNLPGCSPWVFANAGAKGFYRSGYETDAVRSMAKDVETALTPAERIMLLSDIWASVRVNREPIGDYLAVAQGLQADRTSAVLGEMIVQLDFIGEHLVNDADRESYDLWVRQLLSPAAKDVGWEPKPGETTDQNSLRAQLMHALGYTARDPEVEAVARKLTAQAMQDPSSVDHELLSAALSIAARNGDAALYDEVLARLKAAKTPEEQFIYQRILYPLQRSKTAGEDSGIRDFARRALARCPDRDCRRNAQPCRNKARVGFCAGALERHRESGWRIRRWNNRGKYRFVSVMRACATR